MDPNSSQDQNIPSAPLQANSGLANDSPVGLPAAIDDKGTEIQELAPPATSLSGVEGKAGGKKHSQYSPDVADDVDLIEKEWVYKAKEIIKNTSNDPNLQSKEIGKFKADYQNIRYDKDVKVSEN